MNFSQFLLILRARLKIVLITLITIVLLTIVVNVLLPKSYKATSSLVLNYKGIDPLTGLPTPGQLLPGYMATQVDIISSKNVALRVVDELKLAQSPAVIQQFNEDAQGRGTVRDWLADLLLKKLEVVPGRESSVVDISFKGADPQFVAAIANAFAEEYVKLNVQLRAEPMKRASAYFNDQTKLLRDAVEVAQSRLSKYQQENGIVSLDNRLDVESNRLNDLSAQLVMAQGQMMEASSRQRMAQSGVSSESPDVAGNALIQNMRVMLANAESKFAELSQRLDKNHPQYQSSKAELEKMRSDLAEAVRSTSNSVGNNSQILAQREASVRSALAAQKVKVLELNRTRDEVAVLVKDMENAQRAFDATSQRFSQTKIEGQSEQSDVTVLNPAVPPIDPAGPKVLLITLLALIAGTVLGFCFAFVAEMFDRRVRSDNDLPDTFGIPVFGVVEWVAPTRKRFKLLNLFSSRKLRSN